MGKVYEVTHVELGSRAALKMLPADLAQNEEMAARFFNEARAMSLLQHPGLTEVYEYGHLDDGGAYIVMEYVAGESLREFLIKREGKLSVLTALSLVRQVASALQAAHDKGVVHRDLKPENIMISEAEDTSVESHIKILDFGIAKTLDASSEARVHQTRPGQLVGTPTYMAPEQAKAMGDIGGHTDVYALGILLFEMLSSQPPFTGDDAIGIVGKHMFAAPPRLQDVVQNADPELDALINRMLAKSPEARPSMRDLKVQFEEISKRLGEGKSEPAIATEPPAQAETFSERTSTPGLAAGPTKAIPKFLRDLWEKPLRLAMAILLFAFLGLGIWLVLRASPQKAPHIASTITKQANVEQNLDLSTQQLDMAGAAVEGKPPETTTLNSPVAPEGKTNLQRTDETTHQNVDGLPRTQVRAPLKPIVVNPKDIIGTLRQAQNALDTGNYRKAINLAKLVQNSSPYKAWRLIGVAACKLKNVKLSNDAYNRLDTPGQQFIIYTCQHVGIEKTTNGFQLIKP